MADKKSRRTVFFDYKDVEKNPVQQAANVAGGLLGFSAGGDLPLPARVGVAVAGAVAMNGAYNSLGAGRLDEAVRDPLGATKHAAEDLAHGHLTLGDGAVLLGGGAVITKGGQYAFKGSKYLYQAGRAAFRGQPIPPGSSAKDLAKAAEQAADDSEESVISAAEGGGQTATEAEEAFEAAQAAAEAGEGGSGATSLLGAVWNWVTGAAEEAGPAIVEGAEAAAPVAAEVAPIAAAAL